MSYSTADCHLTQLIDNGETAPRRYQWGATDRIQGKSNPHLVSQPGVFVPTTGTLEDLANHIGQGFAWMPTLLEPGARRWQSMANHAELLALDIDGGMTIDEALAHPFVAAHCGLAIESNSSTPEHHKFRLIFPLSQPLTHHLDVKRATVYLQTLVGSADPACKDASRFYFGAEGRAPFLLNHGAALPADFLQQAREWQAAIEAEKAEQRRVAAEKRARERARIQASGDVDLLDLVEQAEERLGQDAFSPYLDCENKGTAEKIRCKPAFRAGSGSRSAFIAENGGKWWYHDPASGDKALSGFWFWARVTGKGEHLRGADWAQAAKEFCALAGIDVPDRWHPPKDPQTDLDRQLASLEAYKARAHAGWLKRREFTADSTINEAYLPEIPLGVDVAVKSAMETGKTHQLARLCAAWDGGVVMVGGRNGLLLQTIARINQDAPSRHHTIEHISSEAQDLYGLRDPDGRVALCWDSLHRFENPRWFEGKLLILDESVSSLKHLLIGGTLGGRRNVALTKAEQLIRGAGAVVLLDGNQSDTAVQYVEMLRGRKLLRISNEFQPRPLSCQITEPDKPRDHSAVLGALFAAVKAGQRVAVVSDSQRLCEALDKILDAYGVKVFRVDSKTMADRDFKTMVADPNLGGFLASEGVGAVILSPSAESGVNIATNGHFSKGFAVFYGILDTDSQTQILRRVREVTNWIIHCPEYSIAKRSDGPRSCIESTLGRSTLEAISLELASAAMDGDDVAGYLEILKGNVHFEFQTKFKASRNYEYSNTRRCLAEALTAQGHSVEALPVAPDDEAKEAVKEIRAALITMDALSIFNADPISADRARQIKASFSACLQDRWKAERALLLDKLPGIEATDLWTPELVEMLVFRERGALRQIQNGWLIENLDFATNRSQRRILSVLEGKAFLGDLAPSLAKLSYIRELGLTDLVGNPAPTTPETVERAYKSARRSKRATALGVAPAPKEFPLKWVGRILRDTLGFRSRSIKVTLPNGDRVRHYYYDPNPHADDLTEFVARSLSEAFAESCKPEWPQTLTGQGLEPVHTPIENDQGVYGGVDTLNALQGKGLRAIEPTSPEQAQQPPQQPQVIVSWEGDLWHRRDADGLVWLCPVGADPEDSSHWIHVHPQDLVAA